jgi:hypothetical protein
MVAQWVLLRAENAILEVQDDDDEDEGNKAEEGENEPEIKNPPPDNGDAPPSASASASATTTARPQTTNENKTGVSGDGGPVKRPRAINIDTSRAREASTDDFGGELPSTPGGWRAEWEWS